MVNQKLVALIENNSEKIAADLSGSVKRENDR
jgi:hypothetical protein